MFRSVAVGAATLGAVGAIVGLVIGLHPYESTWPLAIIEVGNFGVLAGAILGLVFGAIGLGIKAHRK